jgi:hypothetical protein
MAAERRAGSGPTGLADVVGLGRMHLAYNMFPADVIAGRRLRLDLMQPAF